MRFTEDEIENIGYALEEKTVRENAQFTLSLELTEPEIDDGWTRLRDHITGAWISTGTLWTEGAYQPFVVQITSTDEEEPDPKRWETDWDHIPEMAKVDYKDVCLERKGKVVQSFKSKADVLTTLKIGEMKVLSTKVPHQLGTNFVAMCKKLYKSPSERVRELVRADLEEYLKREARRLMFKDVA